MGDLFKGVHLLTQTEYDSLAANEELDPDVLYATPENVTELVRQHTEQIDKNSSDIALNKAEIDNIKNSSGGSSEDIIEIKNTINEIILRDTAQDARLDNIETNFVSVEGVQTITGPKTFIEHIYLANADGTVDRISHLNNNFIIHSGATNSAVLNIDEGLSKIYAFNKELAFKSDIAESSGTTIKVAGTAVTEVGFSSDPQTQIDLLSEGIDNDKTELINNINAKVSKSGDTMTGELNASAGVAFGNNKIKAENSGNTFEIVHLENGIEKNVFNYTHGGIFTLNNSETPVIIQGSDDRPTYVSGSGIMSDLALESDIKTAIDGLGTVFDLKGTKSTLADLPSTGNTIGDVWYVSSEQVGYIWLNDGTSERWERFGAPIELGGYATTEELNALSTRVNTNASNISTVSTSLDNKADKNAENITVSTWLTKLETNEYTMKFAKELGIDDQNKYQGIYYSGTTQSDDTIQIGPNLYAYSTSTWAGFTITRVDDNKVTFTQTYQTGQANSGTVYIIVKGLKPSTKYHTSYLVLSSSGISLTEYNFFNAGGVSVGSRADGSFTTNSSGEYEFYCWFDKTGTGTATITLSDIMFSECGTTYAPLAHRYVVDSWMSSDMNTWYRVWSDGWKECGGIFETTGPSTSVGNYPNATIQLPIHFSNTNYNISLTNITTGTGPASIGWFSNSRDNTQTSLDIHPVRIYSGGTSGQNAKCSWKCSGY